MVFLGDDTIERVRKKAVNRDTQRYEHARREAAAAPPVAPRLGQQPERLGTKSGARAGRPGGGGRFNLGQAAWERAIKPVGSYALDTLDAASETGIQLWEESGYQQTLVPEQYNNYQPPERDVSARRRLLGAVQDPLGYRQEQLESFQQRPLQEQLAGGILLDPLAVLGVAKSARPVARGYKATLGPEGDVVRAVGKVAPGYGGSITQDVSRAFNPETQVTMYHGSGADVAELGPGSWVTPNKQDALAYAKADARLRGTEPRVYEVIADKGALKPPPEQDLAAARGAMILDDPAGATITRAADDVPPPSQPPPPTTGGTPPTPPPIEPPVTTGGRGFSRLALKPGAAEQGTRRGNLLNLRTPEQLPSPDAPDYYRRVIDVASDAARQVSAQANVVRARAERALPGLGKMVKGKDGNWYLPGVRQSPDELAKLGPRPGALVTRVLERPGEYNLTTAQRAAAQRMGDIEGTIRDERALFGVKPDELALEEGQQYIHRAVVKPNALSKVKQRGGGGTGLRIGTDKTRIFDDPADAVAQGTVYAHPLDALDENVATGLKKATGAHIRDLVAPQSRTSADYMPEALRARVQGLRQRITSMQATGVRLNAKQQAIVDDFLGNPEADLDALRDALDAVKVGASATGKQGPNFGRDIAAMRRAVADAKAELTSLLPEWRQAQKIARQRVGNAPGRGTVPMNIAPALAGRDFPEETAKALVKFFGRSQPPQPGSQVGAAAGLAKRLNTGLIPVKATWDFSVLLMQQGRTAVNHPLRFITNGIRSLGDTFTAARYNKWLASGTADDAARHGIAIQGKAGDKSEFTFNSWFERLPVAGKLTRATNRQFTAFNSRMRVDIFNDYVKANERIGRPLDARAKEQLAAGINRLTGVSTSRAGDLEQLAEFAPNFTRSHIETIGKAVADGTIEGQVARRELAAFFGFTTVAIGGLAVYQGRDPSEVLNPINMDALERGQLRLNPNFGTIRIGNEDINIYGPYVSLARLAVVAGNDVGHAGADISRGKTDEALLHLLNSLGNFTGTKGSPVAKFTTDLVRGETFSGVDPASPLNLLETIAPITLSNLIQNRIEGLSWYDTIMDTIAGALGANANPLTPTEQLDQKSGGDFYGLPPAERQRILDENPDIAKRRVDQGSEEFQRSEEIKTDIVNRQLAQDRAFQSGTHPQIRTVGDWRDSLNENYQEASNRRDEVYLNAGTRKGNDRVLDAYYTAIDKATDKATNTTDWDQVDAYRAGLSAGDNNYIDTNTGLLFKDSELVQMYRADMKKLRQDGYFDMSRYRGMKSGMSEDEIERWRQEVSVARKEDPRLSEEPFEDVAIYILRQKGLSKEQIADVVKAGYQDFQNPEFVKYKTLNAHLLVWFNEQLTYEQMMRLRAASSGARQSSPRR